jgi:hypothetical protein
MPNVEEDVIRLLYEVRGQQAIADAQRDLANYGKLVDALRADLASGAIQEDEFRSRAVQLGRGAAQAAADLKLMQAAADGVAGAADRAGAAAERATSRTRGLGQAAQGLGRFFQDLTQGGLGGVLNNLEQLGTSIGLLIGKGAAFGAALGGAMTLVGTAAFVAGRPVLDFFKGLLLGAEKVPETAAGLQGLEERFKGISKELDGLSEKSSLTHAELARFIQLRSDQAKVETQIAEAKERQAAADRLRAIVPEEQAKRAAQLTEELPRVPGGQQALTEGVAQVLQAEADVEIQRLQAEIESVKERALRAVGAERAKALMDMAEVEGRLRPLQAKAARGIQPFREEAQATVGAAVTEGQLAPFRRVEAMMERFKDVFTAAQRDLFYQARPEQAKQEELGRRQAERQEAAAKEQARIGEMLEEEGKGVERDYRAEHPEVFDTPAERRKKAEAEFKKAQDDAERESKRLETEAKARAAELARDVGKGLVAPEVGPALEAERKGRPATPADVAARLRPQVEGLVPPEMVDRVAAKLAADVIDEARKRIAEQMPNVPPGPGARGRAVLEAIEANARDEQERQVRERAERERAAQEALRRRSLDVLARTPRADFYAGVPDEAQARTIAERAAKTTAETGTAIGPATAIAYKELTEELRKLNQTFSGMPTGAVPGAEMPGGFPAGPMGLRSVAPAPPPSAEGPAKPAAGAASVGPTTPAVAPTAGAPTVAARPKAPEGPFVPSVADLAPGVPPELLAGTLPPELAGIAAEFGQPYAPGRMPKPQAPPAPFNPFIQGGMTRRQRRARKRAGLVTPDLWRLPTAADRPPPPRDDARARRARRARAASEGRPKRLPEDVFARDRPPEASGPDVATTAKVVDNQEGLARAVGAGNDNVAALARKVDVVTRMVADLNRANHATSQTLLSNGYSLI